MAKKKIASIPVSTAYSKKTTLGDNWRGEGVFKPGWSQREVEFFSTNLPEADQRMTFSGEKPKTEKAPKVEVEK
jgi:hypothetical protein